MASLAGPLWGACRGMWGFFWMFLILEVLALVQIGRGWWGELGADKLARLERITAKYNEFLAKHEAAKLAGDPDAASFLKRAENLEKVGKSRCRGSRARRAGRRDNSPVRNRTADRPAFHSGLLRQHSLRKTVPELEGEPRPNGIGLELDQNRSGRVAVGGNRATHRLPVSR